MIFLNDMTCVPVTLSTPQESCICSCLSVRGRYRRCTCSLFLVTVHKDTKYLDYNKDFYREFEKISQNHEDWAF